MVLSAAWLLLRSFFPSACFLCSCNLWCFNLCSVFFSSPVSWIGFLSLRSPAWLTTLFPLPHTQAQVRFLARSFSVPGDHTGQQSQGMRWPYGPVALITPFNFPLEIPGLQVLALKSG